MRTACQEFCVGAVATRLLDCRARGKGGMDSSTAECGNHRWLVMGLLRRPFHIGDDGACGGDRVLSFDDRPADDDVVDARADGA
jgi:hypothetical protein